MKLVDRHCRPRPKGEAPLAGAELERFAAELDETWRVVGGRAIEREFRFGDFASAFAFATRIAMLAEREDHHPELAIEWGRVSVKLSTHSVGGLSENDFILAAKIDAI